MQIWSMHAPITIYLSLWKNRVSFLSFFPHLAVPTSDPWSGRLLVYFILFTYSFDPTMKHAGSQFQTRDWTHTDSIGSRNSFFFFPFIFISWRLITLQYCSGFCHTLTWISHGFTCVPHPDPSSLLPPHPIPLGLPSAPALSTCLMHPTWAGGLFHPW